MFTEKTVGKDLLVNFGVLAVGLGSVYVALKVLGPNEMRGFVEAAGPLAPLALIAAKTATIVFAPLSGALLYPLGGTLFGFWKGLLLLVAGDALGGSIAFWISRRFGRAIAERFLGGSDASLLNRILTMMGTVRGFFMARVLLVTGQDLMAYAAGLTKLPYLPFIVIHVGVSLVPTVILTRLGDRLVEDPSGGTVGLIFGTMGAIGLASALALLWYTSRSSQGKTD